MDYTTIVAANSADPASLRYIAPYAGCAMGQELMYAGRDVLIIYDDLSKHAQAYREISLILRRPPGREAYPGDIFYLHSRLARARGEALGRAGRRLDDRAARDRDAARRRVGIHPNQSDLHHRRSDLLETGLFYSGIRPAIDVGLSVSRVGGAAQTKAMKSVAGQLRLELSQYRDLAAFSKLSSDLDKATQAQLSRGEKITETLKQPQFEPLSLEQEVIQLYVAVNDYLADVPNERISQFHQQFYEFLQTAHPGHPATSSPSARSCSAETKAALDAAIVEFKKRF